MEGVHQLARGVGRRAEGGAQLGVDGLLGRGSGDHAVKVLLGHRMGAADKVAKVVGKVGVIAVDNVLVGDAAVGGVGHLGEGKVADAVHAKVLGQLIGINDVPARFGHLVRARIEPRVAKDLFRQGEVKRHQKDRPIDGVEAEDVLADHVDLGGPVLLEQGGLLGKCGIVAEGGDIV